MRSIHRAPLMFATGVIALLCASIQTAHADPPPAAWIPLDASPPGTPANVALDATASSTEQSVVDIVVHGFWSTPRIGDDGRSYQQISVPGLMTGATYGAPELPTQRFTLGVVTGVPAVTLAGVSVLSQATFSDMLPYPHPLGALADTLNTPDRFTRVDSFYTMAIDYPNTQATVDGPTTRLSGDLRGASCEVFPFRWNASGMLTVDSHVRYTFQHPGAAMPAMVGSPVAAACALGQCMNAATLESWVTWDALSHHGYYLFIYPASYENALLPLITQKKKRGLWVSTVHTEDIRPPAGNEDWCVPYRQYIETWYAGTPASADHYCLLVGDAYTIPVCYYRMPQGNGLGLTWMPTDDLFGDVDGDGTDDLAKEVYVGRLSPFDETDLSEQVSKILAYDENPSPFQSFDHAGLIAWNSASDTRMINALHDVQNATYNSVTPVFDLVDGGSSIVNNSFIDGLAQTDGIVCYDGHGGSQDWWAWNTQATSYSNSSILALTNHPQTPVIWSFACFTGRIMVDPCFAERWMSRGQDGAVAVYAGTEETWIHGNGELARRIFDAVFNQGITTHGMAIYYAEAHEIAYVHFLDDALAYLLVGDPEMQIRRTNVPSGPPYVLDIPTYVVAGPVPPPLEVHVSRVDGGPAVGVKVALWKSGGSGAGAKGGAGALSPPGADELLDNRYTDSFGNASFTLPPLTPGSISVTAMDWSANTIDDSIPVLSATAVGADLGPGTTVRLSARSAAHGGVRFAIGHPLASDATIEVFGAGGRLARVLDLPRGAAELAWDGRSAQGALVPAGIYFARLVGPSAPLAQARVAVME